MPNTTALYTPHPAFTQWQARRHGGHQLLNHYWQQHLLQDPNLQEAVLCVQLLLGNDRELRLATRRCTTTSSTTGRKYQFQPSLGEGFDVEWQYEPASANSSAKSLSLTLPNELVDAAALVRQARILSGVAEVSLQVDGGEYDDRLVLLRGDVTDVAFEAVNQLVSLTVTDPKDTVDLQLPPYTLTADRFVNIIDASVGKVLAVVFPGFGPIQAHPVSSSTTTPTFVVAYGAITLSAVYVDGVSYSASSSIYPWQQVQGMDRLGAPYTGVEFLGTGTGVFDGEGGEKVYCSLTGGATNGTIVQIVRRLVEQHTTIGVSGVNPYLFARAEARAGFLEARCAANASGSAQVKALSFIEGTLLESFPMLSMCWWGGGYGPVYTDRTDRQVAAQLVADQWPVLDRASSVAESPKSACFNSFSLYYDYDPLEDTFNGYTERTPQNSAMCELSRRTTGERHADPVESLYITEASVAERVMDWLVAHQTLPSHDVQYDIAPQLALQLMLGDNVKLTDSEFGWAEQIATVIAVTFSLPRSQLTLRVWNDAVELAAAAVYGGTTSTTGGGDQEQGQP